MLPKSTGDMNRQINGEDDATVTVQPAKGLSPSPRPWGYNNNNRRSSTAAPTNGKLHKEIKRIMSDATVQDL